MSADKLITPKELAERWGICVNALRNMRHRGQGPRFIKIGAGRSVRYRLSDIEALEEASATDPAAARAA